MFGYVRPVLDRLNESEKELYQGAYCGLCHAMGKRHGWTARFTLNYDFAFLAVLLYGEGQETETICARCPVHPVKAPRQCLKGQSLEAAADQSMILTWYKLTDDVQDRGFFRGLPYRLLRRIFQRSYQRAAAARPAFELQVRSGMERLREMEAAHSAQLDRVADTFASILAAAGHRENSSGQSRALEQMLYHLGRWIYLIDAWDDLDEDIRKGRYNPLDARFHGRAKDEREYVETTVTHSARLAAAAANLINFGPWGVLVDNVLYSGLPAVQSAVMDGRWKELKQIRVGHK